MADSDITFGFSTKPFLNGIRAVTRGMDRMTDRMQFNARTISRGIGRVINRVAALAAGFLAIRTALRNMPEVGEAFGIAKDIFLRNLLFPLRKEVLPLLQRFLDWVRDNRSAFVKWGQVLATIFRATVSAIGTVFNLLKRVARSIMDSFSGLFGTATRDVSEFVNIMLFKLTAAFAVVKFILEQIDAAPIVKNLKSVAKEVGELVEKIVFAVTQSTSWGEVLTKVANAVVRIVEKLTAIAAFTFEGFNAFIDGFLEGVTGIDKPLERIARNLGVIIDDIVERLGGTEGILALLRQFGDVVGTGILKTFELIADVVDRLARFVQSDKFVRALDIIDTLVKIAIGDLISPGGSAMAITPEGMKRMVEQGEEDKRRRQEAFREGGVPGLAEEVGRQLLRGLNPFASSSSERTSRAPVTINVTGLQVTSTDPEEAGRQLGAALGDEFISRVDIEDDIVREGGSA